MGSILSTQGKKNSPSPRNTTHPSGSCGPGSGPRWVYWYGWSVRWGLVSPRRFRPALSSHRVTDAYRHHCPAHGELVADAAGGPLVGAAPVLDEVPRLSAGAGGAAKRGAGEVLKLRDSSLAVTSDPLRRPWHERYRLQPLHGRWGDRPGHASRAGSGPEASTQRYGGSWQRGFLLSER